MVPGCILTGQTRCQGEVSPMFLWCPGLLLSGQELTPRDVLSVTSPPLSSQVCKIMQANLMVLVSLTRSLRSTEEDCPEL